MARKRKDSTPYFKWRGGKPRWEPGPGVRARGFKGEDLKDAAGNWLSRGAAIDACEKLNGRVRGELPASPAPTAEPGKRTMGAAIALYRTSPKFLDCTARTRGGYNSYLGAIEDWCGDTQVGALTRDNIARQHQMRIERHGAHAANAWLRVVSIVLHFAADDLSSDVEQWLTKVRSKGVEFAHTEGRLVIWTMEEIGAFVKIADFMGRPDLGDACLLGCLTGQSRVDLLTLMRGRWSNGIYRFKRTKTGREVKVPMLPQLERRLIAARERADGRWPNVQHLTELVDVESGTAFHSGGKHFEREFRRMRLFAAGYGSQAIEGGFAQIGPLPQPDFSNLPFMPSLADKKLQDLRDTAVTWMALADCSEAEIATITGHTLATVRAIIDKHYLVRDDAFAISAGLKMGRFLPESF